MNEGRREGGKERKKEGRKDDEHGSWRQLFPFDIYIYIYIYQGSEAWSPWKICPRWWGPAAASWCSDTWYMESSRFSVRGNCCCPPANWSATSPSDRSPHRRTSRNTTSTVAPSIEPSSLSTPVYIRIVYTHTYAQSKYGISSTRFLEAKLHCRHLCVIITLSFVTFESCTYSIVTRYKIREKEEGSKYPILKRYFHLEANDNFSSIAPRALLSSPTVIRSVICRSEFSNRSEESAAKSHVTCAFLVREATMLPRIWSI